MESLQEKLINAICFILRDPLLDLDDSLSGQIAALEHIDPLLLDVPLEELMQCNPFARLQRILERVWDKEANQVLLQSLYTALHEGTVDGTSYTGPCCCMRGIFAKARNIPHAELACAFIPSYKEYFDVVPNVDSPEEVFFTLIDVCDTPENSVFSRIAVYLVEQYAAKKGITLSL